MKKELRKELKKRIQDFEGKAQESQWIVSEIQKTKAFQEASVILAFVPLSSEPDISPLLQDPRILLPYIEDGKMKFSASKELVKSEFGFLEPKEKVEAPFQKALMLVPMLGYDDTNLRLGRGGGFYDRYLADHPEKLYTMGVAFSVSRVEEVPSEWNDRRLDTIIHQ